jgi:hypothetical protein
VIIVLGRPSVADGPAGPAPAGLAAVIALAIAAQGSPVELVGTLADDDGGDLAAIGLGRAGVGHAALLRVPAASPRIEASSGAPPRRPSVPPRLEAADVELGLRYLPDFRVLVVADDLSEEAAAAAAEAAAYSSAAIVAIVPPGAAASPGLGPDVTVLEAPVDAEMPFAATVARYAIALEAGEPAADALRRASEAAGWEPVA